MTDFDRFWSCYPRRKARADAEKAWSKLKPSPELVERIVAAVEHQKVTAWVRTDPKYIPYPATWLRAAQWEDEDDPETEPPLTPGEIARAEQVRKAWGYCRHPQPCANSVECVKAIAREYRRQMAS